MAVCTWVDFVEPWLTIVVSRSTASKKPLNAHHAMGIFYFFKNAGGMGVVINGIMSAQ
jgi:hypothetical protein